MMPSYRHSWSDSPPSVSASLKDHHRLHQQPSSSAYHDPKDKPKKPRHRHSAFQLAALNELYEKDEHPPLEERTSLAERLGMSVSLSVLLLCRYGRLTASLCRLVPQGGQDRQCLVSEQAGLDKEAFKQVDRHCSQQQQRAPQQPVRAPSHLDSSSFSLSAKLTSRLRRDDVRRGTIP